MAQQTFSTDNSLLTKTIDPSYMYCQTKPKIVEETKMEMHKNHTFWNYMMNISMQNTIVQMAK